MRSNVLTIAKKELARFFINKASAFVSIALPGLLIVVVWTVSCGCCTRARVRRDGAGSCASVRST